VDQASAVSVVPRLWVVLVAAGEPDALPTCTMLVLLYSGHQRQQGWVVLSVQDMTYTQPHKQSDMVGNLFGSADTTLGLQHVNLPGLQEQLAVVANGPRQLP
jgi:hypothetical protein